MINSLTYLTRRCPRKCGYCALRDAKGIGPELTIDQWKEVFFILHTLGVNFNLILGNETWLLGEGIISLLKDNKVPYALYTTCPEPLWSKYKNTFFESGIVDNLSCGIDYPVDIPKNHPSRRDDSYKKSVSAWEGFVWYKHHYPMMDCQGTITVHRLNYTFAPRLVRALSKLDVFVGINFIHWNKDNGFDFFPNKEELKDLLFTKNDMPKLRRVLDSILATPGLLQNPEFLKQDVEVLTEHGWHCGGNPYGGPSIDSDGTLRVCGYRRGRRCSQLSIFDLPNRIDDWREAVYKDAYDCPGCAWSYPWMYHYWNTQDVELGKKVFAQHAGMHIPKNKWSGRNVL